MEKQASLEAALDRYERVIQGFEKTVTPGMQKAVGLALTEKASALAQLGRFDEAHATYEALRTLIRDASGNAEKVDRLMVSVFFTQVREAWGAQRYETTIAAADALNDRFTTVAPEDMPEEALEALRLRGYAMLELGSTEEGTAFLQSLLDTYGDVQKSSVRKIAALVANKLADALVESGRFDQAVEVYVDSIRRFDAAPEAQLREPLAVALQGELSTFNLIGRYEDALNIAKEIIKRFETEPLSARPHVVLDARVGKASLLQKLGHTDAAIAAYRDVVERYVGSRESYIEIEIARALDRETLLLLAIGQDAAAIAAADQLLGRFTESRESQIRPFIAGALNNKHVALERLGNSDAQRAVNEELIELTEQIDAPELNDVFAKALCRKAEGLRKDGDLAESIDVWGQVVERYGNTTDPDLRDLVTRAMSQKAELLALSGATGEAIVLSNSVIARCGSRRDQDLLGPLLGAIVTKGIALASEERHAEAMKVFDEGIAQLDAASQQGSRVRAQAMSAILGKAEVLQSLNRHDEATSLLTSLLERFETDQDPLVRRVVAAARDLCDD